MKKEFIKYEKKIKNLEKRIQDLIICEDIIENASDGILIGNKKGEIIGMNKTFTSMTGYTMRDLKGQNISILFSEITLNTIPLRYDLLNEGKAVLTERQIISKNGKFIDIEMNSKQMDSLRYITIVRNIAKRKSVEKELLKNQERFLKLFHNSPLGILICNKSGYPTEINKSFLKILGSESEEFTKKINLLNFKPLLENGFSQDLLSCFETGNKIKKEYEYTSHWGAKSTVKTYMIPIKNETNNISSAFIIAEDINKEKQYISELKRSKEKALESERLKSAFLANMSHEIRTPLNAVLGFAQLFDCNEYSNEELMQFKKSIIKGSNSLLNLIEGIIKLSELQSQKLIFNNEKIEIPDLAEELIAYGKSEIKAVNKDIQCLFEYSTYQKNIYSDKIYFTRVMKHLINNAVKFTDSGFIKIGIYSKNNNIIFYVQDSGIGISDKQMKYIFDKFRQAESSDANLYRGIGMGLALSCEIIDNLKGKINAHSEVGKGSTFEVILPIEKNLQI